jgi:hypothetical protein
MLITEDSGEPEILCSGSFLSLTLSPPRGRSSPPLPPGSGLPRSLPTSPQLSNVRQRPTFLSRVLMTPTPVLSAYSSDFASGSKSSEAELMQ